MRKRGPGRLLLTTSADEPEREGEIERRVRKRGVQLDYC